MPFSGHHEKQTKPKTSHCVLSEFIWSEQVNISAKDRGHRRWCLCRWVRVKGRNVDRAQRASSCSSPGRWDETSARLGRTGRRRTDESDIMGRIAICRIDWRDLHTRKGEGESCSHLDVGWWGLRWGWGNKNGKKGDCVYRLQRESAGLEKLLHMCSFVHFMTIDCSLLCAWRSAKCWA